MKSRFRLMVAEVSGKSLIALALVSLLALPIYGLYARRAARASAIDAHLHATDLKLRTAAVCAALGDLHPFVGEPELIVQNFQSTVPRRSRRLWVVDCMAGAHRYSIVFNDRTGNIENMFAEAPPPAAPTMDVPLVALASADEALEAALRRLQDLQMTPKGTRIGLTQRPQCDRDGVTWRLTWKVLRPNAATPYEVRMVLDGRDATPILVANFGELDAGAQN